MLSLRLGFIIFINVSFYCLCQEIEVNNIKVWGPGLSPGDIVMPARYFFIDSGLSYER